MEYNKNRFQKTNDKKILHKVKKQWVVLSVALLAALGGGATVATTHASANADGANGQNNDQETTVKNRINQNLKLAQNQSANNNASQGQTKQVNVNSLSSDQITKQANMLHNQMLLGAAQGTNTKTANGRQAARQNAETNRINANTSAVASATNQKPAANANHSRMFGAAAPAANFGAMRLGNKYGVNNDLSHFNNNVHMLLDTAPTVPAKLPVDYDELMNMVNNDVKPDYNDVNHDNAVSSYHDLMNALKDISGYKNETPVDNWSSNMNNIYKDLQGIQANNPGDTKLNNLVDKAAKLNTVANNFARVNQHKHSYSINDIAKKLSNQSSRSRFNGYMKGAGLNNNDLSQFTDNINTLNDITKNTKATNAYNNAADTANKLPDATTASDEANDLKALHSDLSTLANTPGLPESVKTALGSEVSKTSSAATSASNVASASASASQNPTYASINEYAPIHVVYENANGSVESMYDPTTNSLIANSDFYTVGLIGSENNSATFFGGNGKSSLNSLGNGVALLDDGYQPTGQTLGSDTNYSLVATQDNGSTVSGSLTASFNANHWTWAGSANNESTPTLIYQANPQSNNNIYVQLINQNGYRVGTSVASVNPDGATVVTSGSYNGDLQYSGASAYGNTINVLTGLSSVNSGTSSSAAQYNSQYDFGLNGKDTNPSFSDYTFTTSEQTVTLPVHGRALSAFPSLMVNVAVRNHKGSIVSSATSSVNASSVFATLGLTNASDIHYGDLIAVDPASFAPKGTDVASSDYDVDPNPTASDNSSQDIPYIYINSQGQATWIPVENKSDNIAKGHDNSDATPTSITDGTTGLNSEVTPAGTSGEPSFADPSGNEHITFNYIYGAHKGTATPINVTYETKQGSIVSSGEIKPSSSDYGDLINIPDSTDVTNPGHAASLSLSATATPKGYHLDYNRDYRENEDPYHYFINSDYNTTSAKDGIEVNGTSSAANDITLFVDGNYETTNQSGAYSLSASVVEQDDNGSADNSGGTMPINLDGFVGVPYYLDADQFKGEAMNYHANGYNDINKADTQTPSDVQYEVILNPDNTISAWYLQNGSAWQNGDKGPAKTQLINHGKTSWTVTTKNGNTSTTSNVSPNNPVNNKPGLAFAYRVPTTKSSTHDVHVNYFYSDMSDVPDKDTPTSKNKLIQLNKTDIKETTTSDNFDLNTFLANPPKGYQFVQVLSDTVGKTNNITGMKPNTQKGSQNDANQMINLNGQPSDTVNIKVIPTAGSITFHYYNQNGKSVNVDPSDGTTIDVNGNVENGSDYEDNGDFKYPNDIKNNTHTEIGNTKLQLSETQKNGLNGYYSRYGTYADVNDIPVPKGYHIDTSSNKPMRRYYRFGREHQDVNVMVVGNMDDVSNDPKHPSDPTITSGDVTDNNNDAKTHASDTNQSSSQHKDADTIWVTVHQMDPQNNQIRQYTVPAYIPGDTGDKFHIYASDFTPEAAKNEQGDVTYHYTPYQANQIHDIGASGSGNDNYIETDGNINSDGTVTATNGVSSTPNYVDYYYHMTPQDNLKPINVYYMDGSTAVGFKEITPSDSKDYNGENISDVKTEDGYGNATGDATSGVPSGYYEVNHPSDNVKYPARFNDRNNQTVIIPVQRDHKTNPNLNDKYTIINNFYSGADGDHSHLVATNSTTSTFSSEYSGEQNFITPSANASDDSVSYSGGSENSTADIVVDSDGAAPDVITFNYYSSAAINPKSAGQQGSSVANTNQPLYVQYFAGSNATNPSASSDYLVGSNNKLTGKSGYTYNDVTKVTPVPEGYYVTTSPAQTLSHTMSDRPYQMDIHVAKDSNSDVNFPVTVILKDASDVPFDKYTTNVRMTRNSHLSNLTSNNYNPNKSEFTYDSSDTNNNVTSADSTVTDYGSYVGPITQATFVYKENKQPSDLGPINVHYIDVNTGSDVGNPQAIKGNHIYQNMSDITTNTGHKGGNSTTPDGYKVLSDQTTNYEITPNTQNVNVLVSKQDKSQNHHLWVSVVEVNKDTGSDTYLPNVVKNQLISSDGVVDPHDYIPMRNYTSSTYPSGSNVSSNDYGPNSTAFYVDPIDRTQIKRVGNDKHVTFFYDVAHQHNYSGSIVLNYYDQYGHHVGYTDVINGKGTNNDGTQWNRYGQRINVNTNSEPGDNTMSHGENTPSGYTLDPNQNVNYTFNNDVQHVDLFVHGQEENPTINIYVHKETKSDPSGNNPNDVSHPISVPINAPVGSTFTYDPNDFVPAGFHVDPNDNQTQSSTILPDGSVSVPNIDFYYQQSNDIYRQPYILRYVNQNGQEVGYPDVITAKSGATMDLTKSSDGGESVPSGYQLASDNAAGSDWYNNQHSANFKFGNNHTINLKVDGEEENVPVWIHLVEMNSDGNPDDATHIQNIKEYVKGQVGHTFTLDPDQYLHNSGSYTVNGKTFDFNPQGLKNNSDSDYAVAPSNSDNEINNHPRRVTIEMGSDGQPYASLDDLDNNRNSIDNQINFYYESNKSEHPAPINVYYYDNVTGNLLKSTTISPKTNSDLENTINNVNEVNGNSDNYTSDPSKQISDHEKGGSVNHTFNNAPLPRGYQPVPNTSNDYRATFTNNVQNLYIPVQGVSANAKVTVVAKIINGQHSLVSSEVMYQQHISAPNNTTETYSPYDYIPTNYAAGSLYATTSDQDKSIVIQDGGSDVIPFDYSASTNATAVQLGTINVHYVTSNSNQGQNIPVTVDGKTYYQVDQQSDHGFKGSTFNLSDYLNDIPSYENNFYHLDTNGKSDNNYAVIGYNDISDGNAVSYTDGQPDQSRPKPNAYQYKTGTNYASDTHPVYGSSQYATMVENQTGSDSKYNNHAINTQDIYVLVAPNNDNVPDNEGNDNPGDSTQNPSYVQKPSQNGTPAYEPNNNDSSNGKPILNPNGNDGKDTGNNNNGTNPSYY